MQNALLIVCVTALGVGGATAIGALLGFLIKKPSHKMNDLILSFAAGVMLAAAVVGLILPAVDYGGKIGAELERGCLVVGLSDGCLHGVSGPPLVNVGSGNARKHTRCFAELHAGGLSESQSRHIAIHRADAQLIAQLVEEAVAGDCKRIG